MDIGPLIALSIPSEPILCSTRSTSQLTAVSSRSYALIFVNAVLHCDEVKEDETGSAYSTHGEEEKCI
jgi:hypothetical protein